jgi:hypothetical protein
MTQSQLSQSERDEANRKLARNVPPLRLADECESGWFALVEIWNQPVKVWATES